MKFYPCAKVNLGLNIIRRREDGYHDLETVFYPIPLFDELTVTLATDDKEHSASCSLTLQGTPIEGNTDDNLVCRAYHLLAQHHPLPPMHVVLNKHIPTQAGLGGGSSDAAAMLQAVNILAKLHLDNQTLKNYAALLGADCAFFIDSKPAYATGIGEKLTPIDLDLKGWSMLLVKPDDPVSTREAYAGITPAMTEHCCKDVVRLPVKEWQHLLTNDFENTILPHHPAIDEAREKLISMKPAYVQMSGSGSTVFALSQEPFNLSTADMKDWWYKEIIL